MTQRWNGNEPKPPPMLQILLMPPAPPMPGPKYPPEAYDTANMTVRHLDRQAESAEDQLRAFQLEAKATQVAAAVSAMSSPTHTPSPSPERMPVPKIAVDRTMMKAPPGVLEPTRLAPGARPMPKSGSEMAAAVAASTAKSISQISLLASSRRLTQPP
eukprot:5282097-Karenia_brevis.AAC.1